MSALPEYTAAQPVYMNDAYIPLVENHSRYLVLRGGGGSGKSVWAAQKIAIRLTSESNHRLLVVRKVQRTLQQSVYQQLLDVLSAWGMMDGITATVSPLAIKCAATGSQILFVGIDDPEKIKSITRITSIWVEEATELELEDFTQLDIRLRGAANYYKQFILTFNPVDEGHWIKKRFFDKTDARATTLLTTFQDNYFLPEEDQQTLFGLAAVNPNYHRIYVLNEWGRVETGNEFYSSFSRAIHVKEASYVPGRPILQSWDANALPYCAMLCAQPLLTPSGGTIISIFQEYALRPPNSGLASTATKFLLDRTEKHWTSSDVRLTGDASLKARKTGDGNQSNYKDIEAAMLPALDSGSMRLWPTSNTRVGPSRDFMNYVLRGGLPGVSIQIDPSCTELIADWELAQLGADGGVFKEMYTEKETGLRYQLRGHFADIGRYLLVTLLKGEYEAFLKMRPS